MRHVVLKLTEKEAEALKLAAGEMLYAASEEEAIAFYGGNKHESNAGYRAFAKLDAALRNFSKRAGVP